MCDLARVRIGWLLMSGYGGRRSRVMRMPGGFQCLSSSGSRVFSVWTSWYGWPHNELELYASWEGGGFREW